MKATLLLLLLVACTIASASNPTCYSTTQRYATQTLTFNSLPLVNPIIMQWKTPQLKIYCIQFIETFNPRSPVVTNAAGATLAPTSTTRACASGAPRLCTMPQNASQYSCETLTPYTTSIITTTTRGVVDGPDNTYTLLYDVTAIPSDCFPMKVTVGVVADRVTPTKEDLALWIILLIVILLAGLALLIYAYYSGYKKLTKHDALGERAIAGPKTPTVLGPAIRFTAGRYEEGDSKGGDDGGYPGGGEYGNRNVMGELPVWGENGGVRSPRRGGTDRKPEWMKRGVTDGKENPAPGDDLPYDDAEGQQYDEHGNVIAVSGAAPGGLRSILRGGQTPRGRAAAAANAEFGFRQGGLRASAAKPSIWDRFYSTVTGRPLPPPQQQQAGSITIGGVAPGTFHVPMDVVATAPGQGGFMGPNGVMLQGGPGGYVMGPNGQPIRAGQRPGGNRIINALVGGGRAGGGQQPGGGRYVTNPDGTRVFVPYEGGSGNTANPNILFASGASPRNNVQRTIIGPGGAIFIQVPDGKGGLTMVPQYGGVPHSGVPQDSPAARYVLNQSTPHGNFTMTTPGAAGGVVPGGGAGQGGQGGDGVPRDAFDRSAVAASPARGIFPHGPGGGSLFVVSSDVAQHGGEMDENGNFSPTGDMSAKRSGKAMLCVDCNQRLGLPTTEPFCSVTGKRHM
eukprot:PhM_4_TR2025/c0_g1_i1/m.23299